MEKTKKIVKTEWKQFGFQSKLFFQYFIVHLIFTPISILIIYYAIEGNGFLKLFGLFSIFYLIFLYFFPSIVAFDFMQNYKDYNIPTLKHPYRWIIFITNLLLAGTGIGWLVLYFWSFIPGNVLAEIVTFEKIISQNIEENNITKQIEEIDNLRQKNLLENDEFTLKKKVIIDNNDNKISKNTITKQIEEIDILRQKGLITNDEFVQKKQQILGLNKI